MLAHNFSFAWIMQALAFAMCISHGSANGKQCEVSLFAEIPAKHRPLTNALEFSPDGKYIAWAMLDNSGQSKPTKILIHDSKTKKLKQSVVIPNSFGIANPDSAGAKKSSAIIAEGLTWLKNSNNNVIAFTYRSNVDGSPYFGLGLVKLDNSEFVSLKSSSNNNCKDGVGKEALIGNAGGVSSSLDGKKKIAIALTQCGAVAIYHVDTGKVETIAGKIGSKGDSDGTGSNARFNAPFYLDWSDDEKKIAVIGQDKFRVRVITLANKEVKTIAGSTNGYATGIGDKVKFGGVVGIAVSPDGSRIVVGDRRNYLVRSVELSTRKTIDLAGTQGQAGDVLGKGSQAKFNDWLSAKSWNPADPTQIALIDWTNNKIKLLKCDQFIKTCADGGQGGKAVACRSAFFTAKAGSTICTKCADDGPQCCTRKPCTISTLGSIKLDSTPKATMATGGKQVDITGLKYAYSECVNPSSVTVEAFQLNSLGFCDLTKSLSAVAKFTGTPATKTAEMNLKIIELNSKSLGGAYSLSGGAATIKLCVRARMTEDGQDILFTENNFVMKYSNGGFSVNMNVDRKKNAVVVDEDLGAVFKVTAYQCNDNYQKITAAILPDKSVLRICVQGESNKFVCDNIATATLKQPGNGITEDNIIVNGTRKNPKYTEVAKKDEFCMLTTHLRAEYFAKKTSSSSLQLVVEGSAAMRNKARRQLKDADDQSPDDKFEISVEIGESGGEPQSTTTWVMGKEVEKDAAVGVYNLAVGTAMTIFTLI